MLHLCTREYGNLKLFSFSFSNENYLKLLYLLEKYALKVKKIIHNDKDKYQTDSNNQITNNGNKHSYSTQSKNSKSSTKKISNSQHEIILLQINR